MANDVHNARCYMLVHQAKRLNSANVVITNHDATVLPAMVVDENGLFIFLIIYLKNLHTIIWNYVYQRECLEEFF